MPKARRRFVGFLILMLIGCLWLGFEGVLGAWFTAVAFVCLIASVVNLARRSRRRQRE